MTERTVVHLLRHGEVYNPGKILYGRLPGFRLSDAGVAMAEKAAAWFTDKGVVHLGSSPLERAQQTARPIAELLDLPVQIDERLIEAGNAFEGLRVGVGDGVLRAPRHWWKLRNPFRPSWGEPYVEIAARMLAAAEAARDASRGAASSALFSAGVPHRVQQAGNMFSIFFVRDGRQVRDYDDARTQDVAQYTAFFHALLARGVYLPPSAFEAWFVNAALSGEALDRVLEALPAAARAAAEVAA